VLPQKEMKLQGSSLFNFLISYFFTIFLLNLEMKSTKHDFFEKCTVCPKEFDSTTLSHVRSLAQHQNFYTF